jgi:hypothetical protein
MALMPDQIIKDLHKILTSSIANTRLYGARVTGFRNELEFGRLGKAKNMNILDGGQFLFSRIHKNLSPENSLTYVTVTDDSKDKYLDFYQKLSHLNEVKRLFFIETGKLEEWGTIDFYVKDGKGNRILDKILMPKLAVFEFKNGGWTRSDFSEIKKMLVQGNLRVAALKPAARFSYMNSYEASELAKIYCNRYVLDVEFASFNKGMIDLDHIMSKDGEYTLIETKEKDPMKDKKTPNDQKKWAFGWDSRRFGWYLYLKHKIGFDVWYIIREIDNQQARNFLKWKKIDIENFCKCASWLSERSGGGGGGTISVPYLAFDDFK